MSEVLRADDSHPGGDDAAGAAVSALPGETYLGDGLFASFDGYQLKLRTGDGHNQVVYLNDEVYEALLGFVSALTQARLIQEAEQK